MEIKLSDHFTYRRLIRFTIPSIATMIFTSVYGVVDGFFVSNYVGGTPFAAQNLIMPFIMFLSAIGFMFGTGGSALVSMTLGMGKDKEANQIFSLLVYLLIGVGLLFAAAGVLFAEPAALFLGATPQMLPYCVLYARISMISLVPFMLQTAFQTLLITAERPKIAFCVTLAAGITNMILDWLFMGILHLGLGSAAAATVIGEFIGGGVPLLYFSTNNRSLLRLGKTTFRFSYVLKTVTNGFSEFMSSLSMSFVSMLYNFRLMQYAGQNGVAAYGIIMYTNFIFLGTFFGYSQGVSPIVGFHYGAEDRRELASLFRRSLVLIGTAAVVMTAVSEIAAGLVASVFAGYDKVLMQMTINAIRICSLSFLVMGFNTFGSAFFTALGNGAVSAAISFIRILVFQTASVIVLPLFLGLNGIWASTAVAELLCAAVTVSFFLLFGKKYGYL